MLRNRGFLAGLAIRLLLVALVTPLAWSLGTVPFLRAGLAAPLSPWDAWTNAGGYPQAFANGYPAFAVLGAGAWAGGLFHSATKGLQLAILGCDVVGYMLLRRLGPEERREEVADLYWLSPALIFLIYWQGGLGSVEVCLVLAAFLALQRGRYGVMGALAGLAIASQPILIILTPFLALYAASLARLRTGAKLLAGVLATVFLATTVPFLGDPAFRNMVLFSPEMRGAVAFVAPFPSAGFSILPLMLVGLVYAAWRARLIDGQLLWTFATVALIAAMALGGNAPGVAILALTFVMRHSAYSERSGRVLLAVLSALLIAWFALFGGGVQILGWTAPAVAGALSASAQGWLRLLAATAIVGVAIIIAAQALNRGVLRSMAYLASRRPLAIGIAGDSGVGKDTLVDSISDLFSPRVVASVSGDDYHLWDRNKPMWRALTHLNPKANDLATFNAHVTNLIDRRWVRARHYDHVTGRMTKPLVIEPGEVVLASGLHALSSPLLNSLFDLRIYVDMDEALRRHFKVCRDVKVRGQPIERVIASIDRREADAAAFIHPQKAHSQLILRLEPRSPHQLTLDRTVPPDLRLVVEGAPGLISTALMRALIAICAVHVVEFPGASRAASFVIEGEPTATDLAVAARRVAPYVHDLLRAHPAWRGGLSGVMQLIVLDQLEQIWRRRSVHA